MKRISLIAIIAAALLAFSGCGKAAESSAAEKPAASETSAAAETSQSAEPEETVEPAAPEATAETATNSTAPEETAEPAEPEDPAAGIRFEFETETIDGDSVTSQELFGENEYTMVNIWTSWCVYCVREMPELEKMNQAFAEKGCGIVGVLFDAYQEGGLEDAAAILDELEVTYPNVKVWKTWADEIPISAVPTSFFVDRDGNLVGEPIVGADLEAYESQLETLLG